MRSCAWLALCGLPWLAGCTGIAGTGQGRTVAGYESPVNIIDTQRLHQMDRTIVRDTAVAGYVEGIRKRLEQAQGESCGCVVLVDGFSGYEAYTLSHKTIVLSAGLIAQADSDDEVAAVIAHELSHVYRYDNVKGDVQYASLYLAKAAGWATGNGAYSMAFGGYVDDMARGLIYHRWNAEQEIEADRFALDILVKAGYSPNGLKMAVRRLSEYGEHAVASRPEAAKCVDEARPEKQRLDLAACVKQVTGADTSHYLDSRARIAEVARAVRALPAEARKRGSAGAVPRFESVDYLFGLNALVAGSRSALRRALAGIARKPLPKTLEDNVAVSNKLAEAYAAVGDRGKASFHLQRSFDSTARTAWTFNQLFKRLDREGNAKAIRDAIEASHAEIGYMPMLLPIEAYLSYRYKLFMADMISLARCVGSVVDDHETYMLCDKFIKRGESGQRMDW